MQAHFKDMAFSVEMFGAGNLSGLAKKDHAARERERLGLAPVKLQKRPYKQLMELRKKQRTQDAAATALAKAGGNTARSTSRELARRAEGTGAGSGRADRRGGASRGPVDGVSAGGGTLFVSAKQIRSTNFHVSKNQRGGGGGGKGRGGGGKGRGRGGGKGKGGRGR